MIRSDPAVRSPLAETSTNVFLVATLAIALAAWVFTIRRMNGMDMGVATQLGSFASFFALWVAMMAAMMLPGAAPAALRSAQAHLRVGAVPLFVGTYLAIWTLAGGIVFADAVATTSALDSSTGSTASARASG